jgi:hypothetical protein
VLRPLNQICSCAYTNQSALQFLRVELDDEKPVVSQHLLFVIVVTTLCGSVALSPSEFSVSIALDDVVVVLQALVGSE